MKINKSFILLSIAIFSITILIYGCTSKDTGAHEASQVENVPANVIAAETTSLQTASRTDIFANADRQRMENLKNTAPAQTPEELKYERSEFGKKLNAAKLSYQKNPASEAELYTFFKDTKASMRERERILTFIAGQQLAAKNYGKVDLLVKKFSSENKLSSQTLADLYQMQASAHERQSQFGQQAEALLNKLRYTPNNNEIYSLKRQIIRSYARAKMSKKALSLLVEFLESGAVPERDLRSVWSERMNVCIETGDPETLKSCQESIRKIDNANLRTDLLNALRNSYLRLKLTKEATALTNEIICDGNATMSIRLGLFIDTVANPIKNSLWGTKRKIWYQFANQFLKDSDRNPYRGKPAFKDMAEEVAVRASEDLNWTVDALVELNCTPNDFVRIAVYLKNIAAWDLKDTKLERHYAEAILAYPGVSNSAKIEASATIFNQALDSGDRKTTREIAGKMLSLEKLQPHEYANACRFTVRLFWLDDKCDEAISWIRAQMDKKGQKDRFMNHLIEETYNHFMRYDDLIALKRSNGDLYGELRLIRDRYPQKAFEIALKYLSDANVKENLKVSLVSLFFDGSRESCEIRKKYPQYAEKQSVGTYIAASREAVTFGNYDLLEELLGYWKKSSPKSNLERENMFLQLYAVRNNFMKISELVQSLESSGELKSEQLMPFQFCSAALQLADKDGIFTKFAKNYKFGDIAPDKRADLILKASKLNLLARRFLSADEAYKCWQSLYKPEPKKSYEIIFSNTPILGIEGFKLHAGNAPIQYMDRKFGGNMDFLVTDVSTGNRAAGIGSDSKKSMRPTEMQTVCDENGIHFLFTAFDEKTRDIEAGTVGAGSFEMYFAPGVNQPYFCLLPDLTNGVCHTWDTTYNTQQWRRPDSGNQKQDIRTERVFTADGYQLYVFMTWTLFFDKLPEQEDYWEFENVHWSRFGGYSWNGMKTIHGRSTWGKLTFKITPEQMLKIKTKIIFAAKKAYLSEKQTNASIHGAISRWKSDKVLGDPAFFAEKVSPTVAKLDACLPLVKGEMTPEIVNKLFKEAVPGWFNIRLIISEMRREYLEEQFTE